MRSNEIVMWRVKLYINTNDKIIKNKNKNITHNHNPHETKIIDRKIINTNYKRKPLIIC